MTIDINLSSARSIKDLRALEISLNSATSEDEVIDWQIHRLLSGKQIGGIGGDNFGDQPRYTRTIDMAVTTIKRALPGAVSLAMTLDPSGEGADLTWWPDGLSGQREIRAKAASCHLPLAILSAGVAALIAKGETDER